MRCAALVSGGKDGWLSCWYAISNGLNVSRIITFLPERRDSFMFHGINSVLVKQQAMAACLEHEEIISSGEKDGDDYILTETFRKLSNGGFMGVVTGAVESEYQRERVERACVESGLVHFAPLWHKEQKKLLCEFLESGTDALIVSVAADGMDASWLGRKLSGCKEDLLKFCEKRNISPIGEGGEFETFVFRSPLFLKELVVGKSKVTWSGSSGFLEIETVKRVARKGDR